MTDWKARCLKAHAMLDGLGGASLNRRSVEQQASAIQDVLLNYQPPASSTPEDSAPGCAQGLHKPKPGWVTCLPGRSEDFHVCERCGCVYTDRRTE